MAHIRCNTPGPVHHHGSSAEARACWTAGGPRPVPAPRPVAPRPNDSHRPQVVHVNEPPTDRQIWRVGKEGGDKTYAAKLNRKQCSEYIDSLIQAKRSQPVSRPYVNPHLKPPVVSPMLVTLLGGIKDGRYAWRPDADTRWTFVRITRPKTGEYAGAIKVQTQHGPNLKDRMKVYPDGGGRFDKANHWLERVIIGICMDASQAAIDYGRELEQCCRCGTKLTDDRSKHYTIGPECEKMWSHIIGLRDEQEGAPYERLARA